MAKVKKRVFKTKKILSGVRTEYRAWGSWDEDDTFIGKLVGTSQNRKNKSKVDWIFEPIDAFFLDKKEQKRVLAAKRITLNTAGMLDKGMEQIEEGETVQIVYNGSKEMEGGNYEGQMAHAMEVTAVEEESDEDDELEDEDEETDDEDDEDEEEDDL